MEANANADGVSVAGEIRREGSHYVIAVTGALAASATSFQSAVHRLATELRRRLPRGAPRSRGVAINCRTSSFTLAYGNRAGDGGGSVNACVAQAAASSRENTLDHALEHAASTLANCCQ
jgi:hypothetical protein